MFCLFLFSLIEKEKIKYVLQLDETSKCCKIKICLVFGKNRNDHCVSNYTHTKKGVNI